VTSERTLVACQNQVWPKGYTRFRALKACMRNANLLALKYSELRLVKGYAKMDVGPWVGHWWCVDDEYRVLDPTWKNQGLAYVGVEIVDLKDHALRTLAANTWELEVETFASDDMIESLERACAAMSS
jgi:hypothetical protein